MKRILAGLAPVVLALGVIGCAAATVAAQKMVDVAYKGTLTDGTVFSRSQEGTPLEFLVGAGMLIPSLEKGLMGMQVGDTKSITLKAADAYGEYDKEAVRVVPREQFPANLELKIGESYQVNGQGGPMVVSVAALTAADVTIDFNHPLAGKDLTFDVTIVKIRDATKDELVKTIAPGQPTTQK